MKNLMQNRPTKTLLGQDARSAILKGVNAIYEPVKRTLGPEGKNALLYGTFGREPRGGNDGYVLSQCQEPKDVHVNLVAHYFREATTKTNEKVGDGTTCTTVIGGKLFNDIYSELSVGQSYIGSSHGGSSSVITMKKNILETAKKVKEEIRKASKKINKLEELEKVASISVEDEKLGKTIAKMTWEVGEDGHIDVVEGHKGKIETEVFKGTRFPAKIPAKGFVNNPKKYEMIGEDVKVVVTNYKIDNPKILGEWLNPLLAKDGKLTNPKIAIIVSAADGHSSESFTKEVLDHMFNANYKAVPDGKGGALKQKTEFEIYPVHAPSLRTEQLEDVAISAGATFFDKNKGMKLTNIKESDLGYFEKIIVKDSDAKEDAIATGGYGTKLNVMKEEEKGAGFKEEKEDKPRKITPVQERINILKGQLMETKDIMFKQLIERRIAGMASAMGAIKVGGSSRAKEYYTKLKIEDAVYAAQSALKSGYVKGGGLCLKEIADKLPDDDVLKPALLEPYSIIQQSAGGKLEIGDNVIDPADAIYYAVEYSTSVVAELITMDSITAEIGMPWPEEGNYAIANMIREYVVNQKIHLGQIKEGEAEAYRDALRGKTEDEFLATENKD